MSRPNGSFHRLLYATSATFPSKLANRRQMLHQMTAFARAASGRQALLAVAKADDSLFGRGFAVLDAGTTRLPVLAIKQLLAIRANGVTHIYCREMRLAALLLLGRWSRLFGKFSISFEVHVLHYPQKLDSWLLRSLVRLFDQTVIINSWMRDEMVRRHWVEAAHTLVAHDAAEPALFSLGMSRSSACERLSISAERFILVYTGRFKTAGMDKGLQSVLRVLPDVFARGVPVVLYAVGGSDSEIEEYSRFARECGAGSLATFIPYIPQADVAAYHFAADVLLMPFPASEHFAHFMSPLKLFEYLMAGRPIIATDLPSVRDVIDERCACIIPPDSDEALSRAIVALASDPALREKLGAVALAESEKYTWDARARSILNFIGL